MRPIGLFPVCRHRIDVVYITHTIRLKLPKEASQRHKQTHVHAAFINSGLSLVNKSLDAVFSRAPPGSLLRLFFFLFCRCRRFAFVGGSRLVLSITFVPFTWSRFESVVNHVLPQKKYLAAAKAHSFDVNRNQNGSSACHALCSWFIELGFSVLRYARCVYMCACKALQF